MKQIRQGDVLLTRLETIPVTATMKVAREQGRLVLADGELTGHAHAISSEKAELFHDPKLGALFLDITGDEVVLLEHEEHRAIALEPGGYQVTIQREFRSGGPSAVMD